MSVQSGKGKTVMNSGGALGARGPRAGQAQLNGREVQLRAYPLAPLAAHAPLGSLRPEESKIAASKPAIPTASTG